MLSLYKLEIFASVVNAGSFSAASDRLFMTQPAVSQHIQTLEASLGTTLFIRGRRGVNLTPAGETLYQYTLNILRLVAEAESAVTDVENLADGQIQIGATPGINIYIVPEWIQSFRQRLPNLGIALNSNITTEIVEAVMGHKLELGFVEGELDTITRKGVGRFSLQDIDLFVIVGQGHPWCERESVTIDMLDKQPFIARQPNSRTRIWMDKVLAQHAVAPKLVAEFDSPESIKQAVMSGMGVTILPEYAITREREARLLRALPIQDVPLTRSLKLIWDDNTPHSPIARAFLSHLAETYYPALQKMIHE